MQQLNNNLNENSYSIFASNLHFDYNDTTKVFEDHTLNLVVEENSDTLGNPQNTTDFDPLKEIRKNKLYGIIGPSGTGKTTLISVLGGQLKPSQGEVLINGVDIYKVDDLQRRKLIAMQMQSATSLRGKLKYNLLFGLPKKDEEQIYSDEYLIETLTKVGLWSLFKTKEGLDTLIGEGGLNLSGGQRQRLNFAGLYLRAKFFQPKLILIDEPTSSLDELSENAITQMILELGLQALTLVVAHRLKTLDKAEAILDSSLFATEKELNFYTRLELLKNSQYYRDLLEGKAILEE